MTTRTFPPSKTERPAADAAAAGNGPRARRLAESVRSSREAMATARPFNSIVVSLGARIAELRVAMTMRAGPRRGTTLANEADALARTVYRQQVAFADATHALSVSAEHDERIGDTRTALDNASTAIELIRKTLSRPVRHTASLRFVKR